MSSPRYRLLLLGSALLLAACGTVDETRKPAELMPVQTTIEVANDWRTAAGGGVDERYLKLSPVLDDGTLFVTDAQGVVTAVAVGEGRQLWQKPLDVTVIAGLQRGPGVLFLGTEDGVVIALSQADGSVLWREQLGAEVMGLSEANLGVVVARTADSRVHGLDVRSGEALWQLGRTTPVLNLRGASRPIVGSGRIIIGFDDGKLVALSPVRGNVLWTTTIANPSGGSELERLIDIDGEIKLVDGIIYVAAFHGRVAAVTLSDGRILWSRELSSHMGLDVDAERVYVTDADGFVWALDRLNGATLWKQDQLKNRSITAPVAIDEYVLVGDFEGYTHWLSQYDGRFVARTRTDSAGILSTPLVENDTVYVLHRNGELAALSIPQEEEGRSTPAGGLRSLQDDLPSLQEDGASRSRDADLLPGEETSPSLEEQPAL
jgi:outer membrane protein assembly factor BamB